MKRCPYCSEEIQDAAEKCRYCGEWLNKGHPAAAVVLADCAFPNVGLGYALGAISLCLWAVQLFIYNPSPADSNWRLILLLGTLLCYVVSLVYWCVALYRIHQTLLKMAGGRYPISPARAVGFQFIPFFNLYWMFKWPAEAVAFINARDKSQRSIPWLPGVLLLVTYLLGLVVGGIWLFGCFGVLSYLIQRLKNSLGAAPEALPYKPQSSAVPVGVIVVICVVTGFFFIGMLAAIAMPSFVRTSHIAKAGACKANLLSIQTAKALWNLENPSGSNPQNAKALTWQDLVPGYLTAKPVCPAGGSYEIGDANTAPTCSIKDNGTGAAQDDHVLEQMR